MPNPAAPQLAVMIFGKRKKKRERSRLFLALFAGISVWKYVAKAAHNDVGTAFFGCCFFFFLGCALAQGLERKKNNGGSGIC